MGSLRLLRRAGRRLVLAGLLGAATELAGIALAGTAAWLIVRAAERPPLAALTVAIVAVRAFALAKGGLRYAERLAGHDATLRVLAEVRTGAFEALQRGSSPGGAVAGGGAAAGGPSPGRGDALARLVSDVDGVQDALLRCLVPAAVGGAVGVAAVAFTAVMAPAAAVVLAVGLLTGGVLLPLLGYGLSQATLRGVAAARGEATAAVVDVVHGVADLTAYGALPSALAAAGDRAAEVARLERRAGAVTALVGGLAAAVPGLTAVGVALTVGGIRGAVLALVALTAVEAAVPLAAAAVRHAELRGALARVAALIDAPALGSVSRRSVSRGSVSRGSVSRGSVSRGSVSRGSAASGPASSGSGAAAGDAGVPGAAAGDAGVPGAVAPHLRLIGATVSYRDGGRPALDGVDLDLPPGSRVAVIGASGSGKSTLLAALSGQVPLAAGSLTVDGVAGIPTGWPLAGGVFADAYLFHASVRDNLTLGRDRLTDEVLADALVAAGLPDWIDRLDDVVGEDGAQTSGGQRQRLLLARALAEAPPVLLLDEPTEGLDPAAADAVLADALRAAGSRTVVVVTHRYAGLAAFDEVVTLDGGRLSVGGGTIGEIPEAFAGGGVRT